MVELLDSFEAIKKHAERCHEIMYMVEPLLHSAYKLIT